MPRKKIKEFRKPVTEYEFPMQKITTVPVIPKDNDKFLEYFVKNLSGKKITMQNFEFPINTVGEPKELTANFQLIGLIKAALNFTIRFEISTSNTDVYFELKLTTEQPMMKAQLVMSANMYQNKILPLITKYVNKAITHKKKEPKEKKPKEPKEKKDKKPDDKEKKEKKPKDPLKRLKMQFVEGEISEEEYFRKKKILED